MSKSNPHGTDYLAREKQLKVVEDRVVACEKSLALLCDDFAAFTRKTARLRDKGTGHFCPHFLKIFREKSMII